MKTIEFSIKENGFRAYFYEGTKKPGKAIIYVGGAGCNEKITLMAGKFLIDEGYSVMILGFYLWKTTSKEMYHIPVDYVENAVKWLNHNGYSEITMVGTSTGSGYTLLCASLLPQITRVIAVSPFDHVMEGIKNMSKKTNCSVYTYHGNDVPYSTFSCIDNGFLKGLNQCRKDPRYGLAYFMRFGYETTALSEESRIKVENINGDILFIGPQKDDCWPSDAAIDRMGKILKEKSFPNNVKTILYEDASHALGNWPMENIMFNLLVKLACPNERKFPQKCKNAREKSIKDIMTFLNEW